MFSKVSVLVPTRQRPDRLRTMLASYEETTRGVEDFAELVFRADDDDVVTQESLRGYHLLVGPRHKGYESLPLFFNEMSAVASGDVMLLGNDDMVFKTPGWSTHILDAANQHPDGVFDIGYATLNATHYPFSTISRRVVEHLGFFWPPHIFWGDIFWRDVMGAFGRTVMLSYVEIEHDWAGFKPDQVFAESDKDIERRDPNYWSITHENAVGEAVAKVRELVA